MRSTLLMAVEVPCSWCLPFLVRLGHVQMQCRNALGGAQWRVSYLPVLVEALHMHLVAICVQACMFYLSGIPGHRVLWEAAQVETGSAAAVVNPWGCLLLVWQPLPVRIAEALHRCAPSCAGC